MSADPFPSPEAISAALRAHHQVSRGRKWPHGYGHEQPDEPASAWDRRRLEAASAGAVKVQPVVALPPCPKCDGEGKDWDRTLTNRDLARGEGRRRVPCLSCKGSSVGGTLRSLANTLQDWCDGLEAERDALKAALAESKASQGILAHAMLDRSADVATLLEAIEAWDRQMFPGRRRSRNDNALISAASKIRERSADA